VNKFLSLCLLLVCAACSTSTTRQGKEVFAEGDKIRFEPQDSFPQEYRHRIVESLVRHGFVIVDDKESTPLACTAEFDGGFTTCSAYIFLRRDGRPVIKVRSENHGWHPISRSAQENRIQAAIKAFDLELDRHSKNP
jgi:hypothetical protein